MANIAKLIAARPDAARLQRIIDRTRTRQRRIARRIKINNRAAAETPRR